MNRIALAIIATLVWSGAMFGAGWLWRGDRAETAAATVEAATGKQALQVEQAARATERQQAETLSSIGAKHEQDREAAPAVAAAVVAGLRAGTLKLRNDLATCHTGRLSEAAAGAVQRDAPAELRADIAGAIVRAGRDADDQLRACQAVVSADRE